MSTRTFAYYIRSCFSYLYQSVWLNCRKLPFIKSLCICGIWFLVTFCVFPSVQMYMSPELVLCRGHSTKTDIYSLGTTIIHMMSGSPPWVRRYPRTSYPSYLYIVSVLFQFDHGASECLPFNYILFVFILLHQYRESPWMCQNYLTKWKNGYIH